MKLIKLAMILLVGQCTFNPLAALSNKLFDPETQTTVFKGGNEYSCYAVERAGNYFQEGLNEMCDRAGYKRQTDYTKEHVERVRENSALTVETFKGVYNCEKEEAAGNYFKNGIWTACNKAGYNRQDSYEITQDDLIDGRIELIKEVNELRGLCTRLSQGMGSTDADVILGCARVGVGVDATNLD
jgi:hypothetical protein